MRISEAALHEAGQAVLAAHLRVPFSHATINSNHGGLVQLRSELAVMREYRWNRAAGTFTSKTDAEIAREVRRQITNRALVFLGGRAAVEAPGLNWGTRPDEYGYKHDEKGLSQLAGLLKVSRKQFKPWREGLLLRAREIAAVPHVNWAIHLVAEDLDKKQRVSSKRVRNLLKLTKESWASLKT